MKKKIKLEDLNREELLVLIMSGGCAGNSNVLEEAVPEYVQGIEKQLFPCEEKKFS
jgi:hypothetical protein